MNEQNPTSIEPPKLILTDEEIRKGAENLTGLFKDNKFLEQFRRFVDALPKNVREMVRGNTSVFRPIPGFEKGKVSSNEGVSYITPIQNQPTQPK